MKNKFFKAVLSAVVAVFAFSLSACEQLDFSEKLDLIASDVDYGYSLYNERYLVIDGTHYKFKTLASEVVEGDGSSEVYGTTVFGGNMYYLYQYSAKKESDSSASSSGNMYRFGVALMKTDLENAETKLLYDFKDVYPNHGERTTPYVMQPIDENSFAFIYNGKISVFDVKTEGITQTIEFYDKEAFAADDNEIKIRTNKFNDFYYLSGEVLTYAEYKPESREYVKHGFAVDEKSFYVNRSENYVYTYRFVGGSTGTGYYNCYDLTTEEAKGGDFLAELVKKLEEQEKERTEEEKQTQKSDSGITVNGKVYRIEKSVFGEPEIINEAGEVVFMIDDDYAAKNNEKLTQLFGVYFSCENGLNADFAFKVFDNRLFIVVSRSALLFETSDFIFEFDFATSNLKYVTYVYGDFEFYKLAAK